MRRFPAVSLPLSALILAVLSLAVLGLHEASAGGPTLTVDTTADDPLKSTCDGGTANDCSLRGAFINARGQVGTTVIELGSNQTYTFDEAGTGENLSLTGDLDVATAITVNGHNSTIDANDLDRAIAIDANASDQIRLDNLTITGGHITDATVAGNGGGISITGGNLLLDNVTITSNDTAAGGGGVFVAGNSSVTIVDSTFSNNTASAGLGGALFKLDGTGAFSMTDSLVTENSAKGGGGFFLGLSVTTSIADTDFTGNTATEGCAPACGSGGGAIYKGAGGVTITGGTFSGNESAASAGALYIPEANLNGVTVTGNQAEGVGGGGYFFGGTIANSTFTNNTAATAGGLSVNEATITHTVISGNEATGSAGGVQITREGVLTHSEVSDNTAGGNGGGVQIWGRTPLITNTTITDNIADQGGGIYRKPDTGSDSIPGGGHGGGEAPDPGIATVSFVTLADNFANLGANLFGNLSNGPIHIGSSIVTYSRGSPDCNIEMVSDGYNVQEGDDCGLNGTGDADATDPLINPLADNGGPTKTRSLQSNSPAIDRVPAANCPESGDDQRGTSRPIGTNCDSGAFESPLGVTVTPTSSPVAYEKVWGDNDCGADVDGADLVELLRFVAGIPVLTQGCFPDIHDPVYVDGGPLFWGDLNCDGANTPLDLLVHLAVKAGATPMIVGSPCPALEDEVTVTE